VVGGDGAVRAFSASAAHEVVGGRPVRVAVEERADDAAVEHARISLVVRLRLPVADELFAVGGGEAANAQALLVRGAAAEAGASRRVAFLQTQFFHRTEGRRQKAVGSQAGAISKRVDRMQQLTAYCFLPSAYFN